MIEITGWAGVGSWWFVVRGFSATDVTEEQRDKGTRQKGEVSPEADKGGKETLKKIQLSEGSG